MFAAFSTIASAQLSIQMEKYNKKTIGIFPGFLKD